MSEPSCSQSRRAALVSGFVAPVVAAVVVILTLAPLARAAFAQEAPESAAGAGDVLDPLRWLREAFDRLPAGISSGMRDMLRELLPAIWDELVPDLPGVLARGFLLLLGMLGQWWLDGLAPHVAGEAVRESILVQTPAAWTYANPDVAQMQRDVRNLALLLVAPLLSWSALTVYLGMSDLERTVRAGLVGLAGVAGAEHAGRLLIDAGNGLALAVLGGTRGVPGWEAATGAAAGVTAPDATQAAINAGAGVFVFALAGVLTFVAAVMQMVGVVVLYVLLPLAAAAYVLPLTQGVAKATLVALGAAVLVKVPGVIALRLGAIMLGSAAGVGGGDGAALVFAVLLSLGVALAYGAFLTKGALFAGGNLVASGHQTMRVLRTATGPAGLRERIVEKQARLQEKYGGAAGAGRGPAATAPRPAMLTHAHTHGHLVGREAGLPAAHAAATARRTAPQPQSQQPQ